VSREGVSGGEGEMRREGKRKKGKAHKFANQKNLLCLSSNADVSSEETIRSKQDYVFPESEQMTPKKKGERKK